MRMVKGYYVVKDSILDIPVGSEVLGVSNGEDNKVILWVKIDKDQTITKPRRFVIFKNEEDIPAELEPMAYIGTGSFGRRPFHAFELVE